MKKIVFLAAAVAAIASCAKVETVSMPGQQEIAFKAINAPTTKASTALESTIHLGVSAMWNKASVSEKVEYFNNVEFIHNGTSWAGGQYWPKTGTLDFAVYAPYNAGAAITQNASTIVIKSPLADANTDFLFGDKIEETKTNGPAIPVTLKHARSQIIVNVQTSGASDNLFEINSIKFDNLVVSGTPVVTYTYGQSPANAVLTFEGNASPVEVEDANLTAKVTSVNTPVFTHYVMPSGKPQNLTVNYSILSNGQYIPQETSVHPITLTADNLAAGTRYIFNLTFTANEILLDASVEDWVDGETITEAVPKTI